MTKPSTRKARNKRRRAKERAQQRPRQPDAPKPKGVLGEVQGVVGHNFDGNGNPRDVAEFRYGADSDAGRKSGHQDSYATRRNVTQRVIDRMHHQDELGRPPECEERYTAACDLWELYQRGRLLNDAKAVHPKIAAHTDWADPDFDQHAFARYRAIRMRLGTMTKALLDRVVIGDQPIEARYHRNLWAALDELARVMARVR